MKERHRETISSCMCSAGGNSTLFEFGKGLVRSGSAFPKEKAKVQGRERRSNEGEGLRSRKTESARGDSES